MTVDRNAPSAEELAAFEDWLNLKRHGERLRCRICDAREFSLGGPIRTDFMPPRVADDGQALMLTMVVLQCNNCFHVELFGHRVLQGLSAPPN